MEIIWNGLKDLLGIDKNNEEEDIEEEEEEE